MKLYFSAGACSLAPHLVLHELGIPFEIEKVDLRSKKTKGGADLRAINPKGYVPALVLDDGSLLTEVAAILQYLADRKPESGLAPANGTMERYRLQEWLSYLGTEIHKPFRPLFDKHTTDERRAAVIDELGQRFAFASKALDGKSFLLGETFTVADAYLFTLLGWSRWTALDLSPWPVLVDFVARVSARPAVQAAMRAEGLLKS